jgi:murein L,D-transpeptidase YcbB/YkuD
MLGSAITAAGQDAVDQPNLSAPQDGFAALQTALEDADQNYSLVGANNLRRFYELLGYHYAWSGEGTAEQHAQMAMMALSRADEEGLDPIDYGATSYPLAPPSQFSEDAVAERDLLLSDAVLRYASDARVGRVAPDQVSSLVSLETQTFDAAGALADALPNDTLASFFSELPPPHRQYARLKSELSYYRQLSDQGGWPQLPTQSEIVLTEGDPRIPLLRERLAIEFPDLNLLASFDDLQILDTAVRLYQEQNGLEVDGRVGPRTLEMLNVPVAWRIEQIKANMERWRWMPRQFEQRYISVNVPDATLEVIEGNERVLRSRVIVGNVRTTTPMFRAEVTGVTANPPWNVPASIARNEMLPRLQSDPRYLADRNMILVNAPEGDPHGLSVDWAAISRGTFPYQVRQLPGPGNALGEIKLELPNRFSVFLHDTSARGLFSQTDRFLSHGCVRVQEISDLASYLLAQNSDYRPAALNDAIASRKTTRLRLTDPVPVYILYWTAVTNVDGTFGFRRDIYSRDEQLMAAVENRNTSQVAFQGNLGCPLPS